MKRITRVLLCRARRESRHIEATVSAETYRKLSDAHRLVVDVVCFRGPHINHLTPRTLDMDTVQAEMPKRASPRP